MKEFYFPLPDNESAFYAFINLVINNRNNSNAPRNYENRPTHFGPVKKFTTTRNEVGERFLVVYDKKDYRMLEMFNDQFCTLRTYWEYIDNEVVYDYASKYDVDFK